MSIQDDIFDVEDALKGKPESECFDRIYSFLGNIEQELEAYRDFYRSVVDLKMAIDKIEKRQR